MGITEVWDALYTAIYMFLKKRIPNKTLALILAIFLSLMVPAVLIFLIWAGFRLFGVNA